MMKRVFYPNLDSLTFMIPDDWQDVSAERLSITSEDGQLEISGTVYRNPDKNLLSFTKFRHEGLRLKMPWYKAISNLDECKVSSFRGFVQEYTGVWPNEAEFTYYRVYTFSVDVFLMGLTFTCFLPLLPSFEENMKVFLSSIDWSD